MNSAVHPQKNNTFSAVFVLVSLVLGIIIGNMIPLTSIGRQEGAALITEKDNNFLLSENDSLNKESLIEKTDAEILTSFNFNQTSDNTSNINIPDSATLLRTSASVCSPGLSSGTFSMTSLSTPIPGYFSVSHPPIADFEMAKVRFFATGNQDVCINGLWLGTPVNPVQKVTNFKIYKGTTLISTIPASSFYQLPGGGTSYHAWVFPNPIFVKANGNITFTIKADIPDSTFVTDGLFNVGFAGINFQAPGASGTAIGFGPTFPMN